MRLSLRALMLGMVVMAGVFKWFDDRARVQREAVAAIRSGGGRVVYDFEIIPAGGGFPFNRSARPWWPQWLVDRVGLDYLARVVKVEFGPREPQRVMPHVGRLSGLRFLGSNPASMVDADTVHLRGLDRLEELEFGGSELSGTGLVNLEGMTRLRRLEWGFGSTNDADLASLSGLTSLEALNLHECRAVTDAGLVHLKPLLNLKTLSLDRSKVTAAGLVNLRAMTRMEVLCLSGTRVDRVAPIREMHRLKCLVFSTTPIDDIGLEGVSDFKDLVVLDLDSTRVSDAGLARLKGLNKLEELRLVGNHSVTDAGLAHLVNLKGLKSVYIRDTGVTDAGIAALRQARSAMDVRPYWTPPRYRPTIR